MKLITYRSANKTAPAIGAVEGDHVFDLSDIAPDMVQFLRLGEPARAAARRKLSGKPACRLDEVTLLAPLLQPPRIFCLAGNYQKHVTEVGRKPKDKDHTTPFLFLKPNSTILPPGGVIRRSKMTDQLDWEIELAAVLGATAKYVPSSAALELVAGYTIVNDISARRLLHPGPPKTDEWQKFYDWLLGKWQDTSLPMGPWIVTRDEIPDPQSLQMTLSVNGVIKQQASTAGMIHTVAEAIAFISQFLTLQPGDLLCTGTPAGVGMGRGEFLQPGDRIVARIERIGELVNTVAEETTEPSA